MRFTLAFAVPLAAVVLGSLAARADDGPLSEPTARERRLELRRGQAADGRLVRHVTGQHLARLEAARAALARDEDRTAARELFVAAQAMRIAALTLDDAERRPVFDVAAQLTAIGARLELGAMRPAALDAQLATAMRAFAAHHASLARSALAREDLNAAGLFAQTALEAYERTLRWRGGDDESIGELRGAIALATDVRLRIAALHQNAGEDAVAAATPGVP